MNKPIIGISGRIRTESYKPYIFNEYQESSVSQDYVNSVHMAGGAPLILPVTTDEALIKRQMEVMDGLLISGGCDVDSLIYGEEPMIEQGFILEEVDKFDLLLIRTAAELNIPILGICRGNQIINVAFGGTLYQDLSQVAGSIKHRQSSKRDFGSHTVKIAKDTKLFDIFGDKIITNSYHHQAVKDVAPGFKVSAKSLDGVIEGIEKVDSNFVVGVQWHPEMMFETHSKMLNIFKKFVAEAAKNK